MKLTIETAPIAEARGGKLSKHFEDFKALARATELEKDPQKARFVTLPDNNSAMSFVTSFNRFLKGTGLAARRRGQKVYCFYSNGKHSTGSTPQVPPSQ